MIISAPGGGGFVKLAPDLTSFSDRGGGQYVSVTAIDATGSLTTLLSLTGKFIVDMLALGLLTTGDIDKIKLTIDGVVIWNETGMSVNGASAFLIGTSLSDNWYQLQCDVSLLLQLQTTVDTSISLNYSVRPIL